MQLGEYFIVAGTIVGLTFKSTAGQQVSTFLTQVGTSIVAGMPEVPAFRIANYEIGPIPLKQIA